MLTVTAGHAAQQRHHSIALLAKLRGRATGDGSGSGALLQTQSVPVQTEGQLLAWGDKLRAKVSSLASRIYSMEGALSHLEGRVVNLTISANNASSMLGVALAETAGSMQDVTVLKKVAANRTGTLQVLNDELDSLEPRAKSVGFGIDAAEGTALADKIKKTEAAIQGMLPGGEVEQKLVSLKFQLHEYEQDVRASVERVLTKNNSYELRAFKAAQEAALSNLSNITSASVDGAPNPCNSSW